MIMQPVGMRRILLFAWAVTFVTLVRLQIPETTLLGVVTFTLAVWAAFYPLAATTSVPVSRYWMMLAVGVPLVVLLHTVADQVPYRADMTLLVLAASGLALFLQWSRRRSRERHV